MSYTVYRHTSPSGKMYIGITYRDPHARWQNGYGYHHNEHFTSAIQKYGWDKFTHEIIADGISKEQAEQMEVELIAKYNLTDPKYGYNIENGGNSIGKHSEETKAKIAKAMTGRKDSEETKLKKSMAMKGKKYHCMPHTEETKRKISEAKKGQAAGEKNYFYGKRYCGKDNPMSKPVCKYDMDGNFLERRESANQFAIELNIINATHISDCCKGRRKSAYGYIWRYDEEGSE